MTRTLRIRSLTLALVLVGVIARAEDTKPAAEPAAAKPDAQAPAATKGIQWQPSYDVAMAEAKKTSKPVMIDFYTDWCGWCKVLDKQTYTDPQVIDAASKMLALKINAEKETELAKKYNVDSYPRIVFLTADGKVIHEIKGFKPPDQFLPDMKAVLQGKSPSALVDEMIKKGTDDPDELAYIGRQLLDRDKPADALPYLEKAAAKLPDEKKLSLQPTLAFLYLDQKQREKADAAFEAYKKNPKADPEKVAETEVSYAFRVKDRKRTEAALNRLATLTTDEGKKNQVKQLLGNLDKVFQPEPTAAPEKAGEEKPADQKPTEPKPEAPKTQ